MDRTKGVSLAKGPVGIIGAVLLAGGILGLLMGSTDFTTSAPNGDVSGGTFLGIEGNGWTWLLFAGGGLLLLLSAPMHWSAKTMAMIVGLAMAAAALRCNNCNRPICAACAVRTPIGYRCRECVKGQQKAFDTSEWYDYITGFIVAVLISVVASFLVTFIGGIGFFGWFLIAAGAPTAGVAIAEGVRLVTGKRRSRPLFMTVVVGVVLGALPVILFQLVFAQNLFGLLFQVIYLVIAVPVVYSRLSGIQLFR